MKKLFFSIGFLIIATFYLISTGFVNPKVGWLEGNWLVQCSKGHRDWVNETTMFHNCETCSESSVSDGKAMVVCSNGHASFVEGVTKSHICPNCRIECRRY